MGKTTLARELIEGESRVIVLDTMGGYGSQASVVWGRDEGIDAMLKAAKQRRFKLALRVVDQDDMLDLLDMAWELEDYLLVIEETSLVTGTPPFLHRQLGVLVRYGRHRRISQVYIARRPTEIPRDLTAQSDLIVTFHQKEPRDLLYLQANGFDPRQVTALPDYQVAAVGSIDPPLPVLKRMHQRRLFDPREAPESPPENEALTDPIEDATEDATAGAGGLDMEDG